jgi:hypothetical protein
MAEYWPWGKHKGTRFEDVPTSYLKWFLRQDWAKDWPDLVKDTEAELEERQPSFDFGQKRSRARGSERERKSEPPPGWSSANGNGYIRDIVQAGYQVVSKKHHPDFGGTHDEMVKVNLAMEEIRRVLKL